MRVDSKSARFLALFIVLALVAAGGSPGPSWLVPPHSVAANSGPAGTGDYAYAVPRTVPLAQAVSQYGNTVSAQLYVYAFSPLGNRDAQHDYYFFDFFATATPSSGWSIDDYGISDPYGPTLQVAASLSDCSTGSFSGDVEPPGQMLYESGASPATFKVGADVSGTSAGVTVTFTPPQSQSAATSVGQCSVQWNSGYCDLVQGLGCVPGTVVGSAYSYHFQGVVMTAKGQTPALSLDVTGNFWENNGVQIVLDHVQVQSAGTFATPPVITVSSAPAGAAFALVDGAPVTTPQQFVWYPGDIHEISAASTVAGAPGTQYVFTSWSDDGAQTHNVTVPSTSTAYVASYREQDELNVSAPAGGTTNPSPGSYWFDHGQSAVVESSPLPGYVLDHWVLDGADVRSSQVITLNMSSPHSLQAVYSQVPTGGQGSPSGGGNNNNAGTSPASGNNVRGSSNNNVGGGSASPGRSIPTALLVEVGGAFAVALFAGVAGAVGALAIRRRRVAEP